MDAEPVAPGAEVTETFSAPEVLEALTRAMCEELSAAIGECMKQGVEEGLEEDMIMSASLTALAVLYVQFGSAVLDNSELGEQRETNRKNLMVNIERSRRLLTDYKASRIQLVQP